MTEKERKPKKGWKKSVRDGYAGLNRDMDPENDRGTEIGSKKKRFWTILGAGVFFTLLMFLVSISASAVGITPISEALSAMVSAIQKGGEDLTNVENYVYYSRLPRTLAAIGVGAGLAVAGCMLQALIRNPLVDPYISGVSSGAGCMAVAFTALGASIPALGSVYLTPVAAIIGGLLAFGITMGIAECAGGSATNYILSGVIVGFAFSSVQTAFLSMDISIMPDTAKWLYGSFSDITWENAFLVLVPAIGVSLLSMMWAREYNLFMSGEQQASQLGLNVRLFKAVMMVVASVLTAICVSFAGIIGFVGLVIPHACRMMFGGDHRLVLPASLVLGACLMLFSDVLARTLISPMELPIGVITALIGTPIFAYMLIRRGREYDG
ncbi:MAG: iron ABC transporter permease [archaeon]|nr:iron ABC transporter permease [archaeon]